MTQLDARHAIQTNDGPFKAKVDHVVEVIGIHRHLLLNNMECMSSISPPLDEALHQSSTYGPFWQTDKDRLKAHFPNVSPRFRNKEVIPLYHLVGASPTSIRGCGLQKKKTRFWIQVKMMKNNVFDVRIEIKRRMQ